MARGIPKYQRRPRTPVPIPSPAPRWATRRLALLCWGGGVLILAADLLYPVSTGYTRMVAAVLAIALPLGLLVLGWRWPWFRWPLLAVLAAVGVFAVAPGRSAYDRIALRDETVRALLRYEGARYVWGGETGLGIDCSGLVRRGAIDALFLQGVRTVNPLLVRKAVSFWWTDSSARDLGAGAGGKAQRLHEVKAIAGMDDSRLHPGDFAVTRSGIHTLAYLGDGFWLEADPEARKVIRVAGRTGKGEWFTSPVALMRWHHLELPQLVGRRRGQQ